MNSTHPILDRYPDLKELIKIIRDEVHRNQRPPEQTIIFDEDVMVILGVSKRKLQYMKAAREIGFQSPPGQRDYYFLSDIFLWLKKYRVEPIDDDRIIDLKRD